MEGHGISAAVAASGASRQNIVDWDRRRQLMFQLAPAGRGRVRLYSLNSILEFALLKEFSNLGVHVDVARAFVRQLRYMPDEKRRKVESRKSSGRLKWYDEEPTERLIFKYFSDELSIYEDDTVYKLILSWNPDVPDITSTWLTGAQDLISEQAKGVLFDSVSGVFVDAIALKRRTLQRLDEAVAAKND